MPVNAYATALSSDALRSAWRTLLRRSTPASRRSTGTDEVSIEDITVDERTYLNRLARNVRQKTFAFSELRPHLIPKPNKKDRLICVPTVQDRIVQRALLDFLEQRYSHRLANKVSFGFVKNRGVKKAVQEACRLRSLYGWVYKTDITSFFDSIKRPELALAMKRMVRERSLHPLLLQAMHSEVASSTRGIEKRIAKLGIKRGVGIRQGMPLSPFFSNIMLCGFDREIEQQGFPAVRYADDLIFFASSRSECFDIAEFCTDRLAKIGLTVPLIAPDSKSVIYAPGEPAEFLGVSLSPHNEAYRLELAQEQITAIRDELLKLSSIAELNARRIPLSKLGYKIVMARHGYLAAYDMCANVQSLERELLSLEQRVLRRVYTEGLGINLQRLSAEARTFLGLT